MFTENIPFGHADLVGNKCLVCTGQTRNIARSLPDAGKRDEMASMDIGLPAVSECKGHQFAKVAWSVLKIKRNLHQGLMTSQI